MVSADVLTLGLAGHRDGQYVTPDGRECSYATLYLFLNGGLTTVNALPSSESSSETFQNEPQQPSTTCTSLSEEMEILEGGSTRFWGAGKNRQSWVDVPARTGRVLVFQHKGLTHSGEPVIKGSKFTMRTDLMYKNID